MTHSNELLDWIGKHVRVIASRTVFSAKPGGMSEDRALQVVERSAAADITNQLLSSGLLATTKRDVSEHHEEGSAEYRWLLSVVDPKGEVDLQEQMDAYYLAGFLRAINLMKDAVNKNSPVLGEVGYPAMRHILDSYERQHDKYKP
jgi:hypothetical protein